MDRQPAYWSSARSGNRMCDAKVCHCGPLEALREPGNGGTEEGKRAPQKIRWKTIGNPATGERRREGGSGGLLEAFQEPGNGGMREGRWVDRSIGSLSGTWQRGNERGKVGRRSIGSLSGTRQRGNERGKVGRQIYWKPFRNLATGE